MSNLIEIYSWLLNKGYPTNEDTLQLAEIISGEKGDIDHGARITGVNDINLS